MGRSRSNSSLHVSNLAPDTRVDDIKAVFEPLGSLRDVYLPLDFYTKRPRGFCYVEYRDDRDADDAYRKLDGVEINGQRIRIQWAKGDRKTPNEMLARERDRSRSRSPRRRSRSPRRRSRSPRRRSRSRSRSRYDRRRTRSRSRSRSRRASRSPRRASRSPRRDSRSPRRASRSPRRASRSPRRDSRSPRRSSPPVAARDAAGRSPSPAGQRHASRSRSRSPRHGRSGSPRPVAEL